MRVWNLNRATRKCGSVSLRYLGLYLVLSSLAINLTIPALKRPSIVSNLKSSRSSNLVADFEFRHYLSACVIVRESSDILGEFLVRNYLAGVDHFFIYGDDSDPSEVQRLKILFQAFNGIVTYLEHGRQAPSDEEDPENYVQMRMYRHCVQKFGMSSKWVTLIDSDEFFETSSSSFFDHSEDRKLHHAFLHDVLKSHEMTPVLCVRWKTALTNGRIQPLKQGETIHESFPNTCKTRENNSKKLALRKMILQPRFVDLERTPKQDVAIHKGFRFSGPMKKLHCKWGLLHGMEPPIHLIHYWSRDLCSFLKKIRRGRPRKGVPMRNLSDLLIRESACVEERGKWYKKARVEAEKRLLLQLPVFPERKSPLGGLNSAIGNQNSSIFRFSEQRMSRLISEIAMGSLFSNEAYCENRESVACASSKKRNYSKWPFPWVEYITSSKSMANEDRFFTSNKIK